MQACVLGEIDNAHAAAAEQSLDAIRADGSARFEERARRFALDRVGLRFVVERRRRVEKSLRRFVRGEERSHFVLDVVWFGRGVDEG